MTDVRARMKDLDALTDPDLWTQIETRSTTEGTRAVAETPSRPSRGRRARAALLAAVVFAVAGVFVWQAFHPLHEAVPTTAPKAPGVWSLLHRPLQLPSAAAACPSSPLVSIKPIGGGFSGPGSFPARGKGPVFVVAEPASPVVRLRPSDRTDGGWYGLKTIFTANPTYRGPLLIRVAQLAGSGGIRFQRAAFNAPLPTELHLTTPADSGGVWVSWPTVTLVRSTGCFAYQIDGTTFTEVIVFEARTP